LGLNSRALSSSSIELPKAAGRTIGVERPSKRPYRDSIKSRSFLCAILSRKLQNSQESFILASKLARAAVEPTSRTLEDLTEVDADSPRPPSISIVRVLAASRPAVAEHICSCCKRGYNTHRGRDAKSLNLLMCASGRKLCERCCDGMGLLPNLLTARWH
jgi:hypothetical protein